VNKMNRKARRAQHGTKANGTHAAAWWRALGEAGQEARARELVESVRREITDALTPTLGAPAATTAGEGVAELVPSWLYLKVMTDLARTKLVQSFADARAAVESESWPPIARGAVLTALNRVEREITGG
jgi:hypothetical protein